MQLYALDSQKNLVFAKKAAKQLDYFCIECQQIVRLRGGPHRHAHFYHLATTSDCRQNSKSMAHIQNQLYLYSIFPAGEAALEVRFPEINRIADVVWLKERLVFEIQCSPISATEVQNRNRDYASRGFQVIWILHDNRFNQSRLTAAELFLRTRPYYFTSINAEGQGIIYDQFDIIEKGRRKYKLVFLKAEMHLPKRHYGQNENTVHIPQLATSRLKNWPLRFSGDFLDTCLSHHTCDEHFQEYIRKALEAEAALNKEEKPLAPSNWKSKIKHFWCKGIVRPYRLLFQIILERACK